MNWQMFISHLLPNWAKSPIRKFRELYDWEGRGFDVPAPNTVKRRVLLRNGTPNATWVETGTYYGETTLMLSKNAFTVHTIEPSLKFFDIARERLSQAENVFLSCGTSEECLPEILGKIKGNVNFWLDGHFSGGETFQGAQDTPILNELEVIAEKIDSFDRVVVIIDDVRCFGSKNPEYSSYPEKEDLIDWARKLGFSWHIEFDMFIAKNFSE